MASGEPSLHAVLDTWGRHASGLESMPFSSVQAADCAPRTEFSATVFSGDVADWVRYLGTAAEARYERGIGVRVHLQPELHLVAFEPEGDDSRWLAELLQRALGLVRSHAERKPNVLALLDELLFTNPHDAAASVRVVLSDSVPSTGTREAAYQPGSPSGDARFVLHSRFVWDLQQALEQGGGNLSATEQLGLAWPLVLRLLSQIAYPLSPRDRFVAKIDASAKLAYLAINVLYEESRSGQLVPNAAGVAFEALAAKATQIPRQQLFQQHPYFRTLGKLSFMLRARPYASYADEARIASREFLDTLYLRVSLASAMPGLAATILPMPFERKKRKVTTPGPRVGLYGIVDEEDQAAWKQLARPFRDIGFVLLRQIGVGDFGRVYEALNEQNSQFPPRVALKVDRIVGRKKHAILEAEAAMRVGSDLARAPHLIRLYDTGKLPGERFTFHVLQLINGDTLDSLIQVTGAEHASTGGPQSARTSELQAREEYDRAVRQRGSQQWRQRRMGLPFKYPLSAAMLLDMLTSVLLTLEEVHQLGYAINDLKNDNLMMSRRGQLKGIDLDSFSPILTPFDKVTDFLFLAAAIILQVLNAPSAQPGQGSHWKELAESEVLLRRELARSWPFGDVTALSDGRVGKQELADLLVDLVQRCHSLAYSRHPELFSADIARLIGVKRRLLAEEFVID